MRDKEIELHGSGGTLPYGLCVWSTGVGPTPFTLSLPFAKTSRGRLAVDDRLRVLAPSQMDKKGHVRGPEDHGAGPQELGDVSMVQEERKHEDAAGAHPVPGVWALGDCCADVDNPLPALAQVAEQQGRYLAACLNESAGELDAPEAEPFKYKRLGAMASVGGHTAIVELGGDTSGRHPLLSWGGFSSWVAWRSAYLTRLGSMKHRAYVASNWTLSLLFGRDISRW